MNAPLGFDWTVHEPDGISVDDAKRHGGER